MADMGLPNHFALNQLAFSNSQNVYWNLSPSILVEEIILRSEGILSDAGAVIVKTGKHTGRSPKDKYIVCYENLDDENINWGDINHPITPEQFQHLYTKITRYFHNRDTFIQDLRVGSDSDHQVPVRIITDTAWQSLASRNLLLPPCENISERQPFFTILSAVNLECEPDECHLNSGTFIAIDFSQHLILIGGTGYAGEIKKSIFTMMHYYMPKTNILSMHCSANVGEENDVALFFGLSGTGKTTLSSDMNRSLIGDDEHGWSDQGVFNFEGGCYAKTINLNQELEPLIWDAVSHYGTVIENVICEPQTRKLDFRDNSITDNTRAAYPINFIKNYNIKGTAGHPRHIFFLTADAFGVLPPIARLSLPQTLYYFLSGYTSKLAGTEDDLGKEPQATFSCCYAAPFLPFHPCTYAELLKQKIIQHNVQVWLINTGWNGGPYGIGKRIPLSYSRASINEVLATSLSYTEFHQEPYFDLWIPDFCKGIPSEFLNPKSTWKNPEKYDQTATYLKKEFKKNFNKLKTDAPELIQSMQI